MSDLTPSELNAAVIWEELCLKYTKFWFSEPIRTASDKYTFVFVNKRLKFTSTECQDGQMRGNVPIDDAVRGFISIGDGISLSLHEIPLADVEIDLSVAQWSWILADPNCLDRLFKVMDCIYSGFHQYRQGQTLQIGQTNLLENDDVLDKEQTVKKMFMKASEILGVPYQRPFIVDLQETLKNPEFNKASEPSDWRTHIATDIRENWHFLDELARILFWMGAMEIIGQIE